MGGRGEGENDGRVGIRSGERKKREASGACRGGCARPSTRTWHWYMLRGDWLKSEKGVKLATTDSMLVGSSSKWVVRPGLMSELTQAMFMKTCTGAV